MAVLDDIKTLLKISDTSKDAILNLYVRKANIAIKKYFGLADNDTTDISLTYPDAVCQFVIECVNRAGDEGIKQSTTGGRQSLYQVGLSDDVKTLLPLPSVKMG